MPRTGVYTSAEERQRVRQSYYNISEKEAGMAHLWHLQQLADIRFNPNHTIQDAPDVDFRSSVSPSDAYRDLFAQRAAQQVQHDEARIHEQNKVIYRNIVLASDSEARRARHMNLVPTEDQVKRFDNIEQQTLHRTHGRERRQRVVAEENKKLLDHLISVPPHVQTTKQLDTWYHTVHKKRLAQLSKFKPAEQYAGARLLEGTTAYAAFSRSNSNARYEGSERRGRMDNGAAPPLIRGQPYPSPTIGEAVRGAPSALLPAASGTTYNGVPLSDSVGVGERTASLLDGRRPRRPEWQPIAATDIPLLHYSADQQLRSRTVSGMSAGANKANNANDSGLGKTWRAPHRHTSTTTSNSRLSSPAQRELFLSSLTSPEERIQGLNVSHSNQQNTNNNSNYARIRIGQGARCVTANEEGGVTQLWRRAVQDYYHSNNSTKEGKSARAATAHEAEDEVWNHGKRGEFDRSSPSPRGPHPPSTQSTPQQVSPISIDLSGPQKHQQRRLPKKMIKAPLSAASARQPRVAVCAAQPAPITERCGTQEKQEWDESVEEDNDEAAALYSLMEGWSRRSEGGNAAYAPV